MSLSGSRYFVPFVAVTVFLYPVVFPPSIADAGSSPSLDLTVLLHGTYHAQPPLQSRGVDGDYGVTIELRDTFDGSGVNFRYFHIPLNSAGQFVEGPLDLGPVPAGEYYLAVTQLTHLAAVTADPILFESGAVTVVDLSDPLSPDYCPAAYPGLYQEEDGLFSLHAGNGSVEEGQDLQINLFDILVWSRANGAGPGNADWNIHADYDANGVINILDIISWSDCNGAYTTVSIPPLSVVITSPSEGYLTSEALLTVTGRVNDGNAVIVINDTAATVAGGIFMSGPVALPYYGEHVITVRAEDRGGNVAVDSVAVNRLPAPTPTPTPPLSTPTPTRLPSVDSDGDGLSDSDEFLLGSDPFNIDTDRDGIRDGDEFHEGSDPLDSFSRPPGYPTIRITVPADGALLW